MSRKQHRASARGPPRPARHRSVAAEDRRRTGPLRRSDPSQRPADVRRPRGDDARRGDRRGCPCPAGRPAPAPKPAGVTVAELAGSLIADMRSGRFRVRSGRRYKPSTVDLYQAVLEHRIVPELGAETPWRQLVGPRSTAWSTSSPHTAGEHRPRLDRRPAHARPLRRPPAGERTADARARRGTGRRTEARTRARRRVDHRQGPRAAPPSGGALPVRRP